MKKLTRIQKEALTALSVLIVVGVLIFSFYQGSKSPDSLLSGVGGNFTLQGVDGQVELEDFRGKVLVIYFGFTFCPDICPRSLSNLAVVINKLPEPLQKQIQPLFISVDHKRDTPAMAQEYAKHVHPSYIGLSGSKKQLKKTIANYGGYYEIVPLEDSSLGHTVDHSSRFYLIDKKGRVVKTYSEVKNNKDFLKKLKELAKSPNTL